MIRARTVVAVPPGAGAATASGEADAMQAEYDGPPIPEDITGKELDRAVIAS